MIPPVRNPGILDIGCGPGGPTRELARISGGMVTGIDLHYPYLARLKKAATEKRLSSRIQVVLGSMDALPFFESAFDILWEESSIYLMGFERGLREWKQYISPDGFAAVNEITWLRDDPPDEINEFWQANYPEITTITGNLKIISECGYELIDYFPLPEDAWWEGYYRPLEKRLKLLRKKYHDHPDNLSVIEEEQKEIELYRKYYRCYGSVFFVMQKT